MTKPQKIAYWILTILICAQLIFTGAADILLVDQIVKNITHVGFPISLIPFLGGMKVLGALTILFVRNEHLRVGAYAGVLFYGLGAAAAHLTIGDPLPLALPALVFMAGINLASYYLWRRSLVKPATTPEVDQPVS